MRRSGCQPQPDWYGQACTAVLTVCSNHLPACAGTTRRHGCQTVMSVISTPCTNAHNQCTLIQCTTCKLQGCFQDCCCLPSHKTCRGGSATARCAMNVQAAATHTIHNWLHQLSLYKHMLETNCSAKSMHSAPPAPRHLHCDGPKLAKTDRHACKSP